MACPIWGSLGGRFSGITGQNCLVTLPFFVRLGFQTFGICGKVVARMAKRIRKVYKQSA